jgi:hypothetical protein
MDVVDKVYNIGEKPQQGEIQVRGGCGGASAGGGSVCSTIDAASVFASQT